MTWLNLRDNEIRAIRDAAERPMEFAGVFKNLAERIEEAEADCEAYAPQIKEAKSRYQRDGEIEIDGNAPVSPGDDPGVYVGAWVWVPIDDPEREWE